MSGKEASASRYKKYKESGRCVNCGSVRERQDRATCNRCREVQTERTAKLHNERKAKGLCVICGDKKRKGKVLCTNCSQLSAKRRRKVVVLLGGKCECCGVSDPEFLAIDHKDGGGSKQRKETNDRGGMKLVSRILKGTEKTSNYRVLCHNCNMATRWGRVCPHRKEEE